MQNFSFLSGLVLVDSGRIRPPKERNPKGGLLLRVFNDGTVYPSQELVEKFDLEYRMNRAGEKMGNGIDVIDSHEWNLLKEYPRMIVFGITPKTCPKVELFSTTRLTDDGKPKASVMTQAPISVTLLELVRSMGYLTEEQKYCDLVVVTEHPIVIQDGISHIPKVIERGGRKGEKTYERRENVFFYPVTTPEVIEESKQQPPAVKVSATEDEITIN